MATTVWVVLREEIEDKNIDSVHATEDGAVLRVVEVQRQLTEAHDGAHAAAMYFAAFLYPNRRTESYDQCARLLWDWEHEPRDEDERARRLSIVLPILSPKIEDGTSAYYPPQYRYYVEEHDVCGT